MTYQPFLVRGDLWHCFSHISEHSSQEHSSECSYIPVTTCPEITTSFIQLQSLENYDGNKWWYPKNWKIFFCHSTKTQSRYDYIIISYPHVQGLSLVNHTPRTPWMFSDSGMAMGVVSTSDSAASSPASSWWSSQRLRFCPRCFTSHHQSSWITTNMNHVDECITTR